jgi:hypothetical protein
MSATEPRYCPISTLHPKLRWELGARGGPARPSPADCAPSQGSISTRSKRNSSCTHPPRMSAVRGWTTSLTPPRSTARARRAAGSRARAADRACADLAARAERAAVSEATGADIEHLDLERGHRTLTITRIRAARSSPSRSRRTPPGRSTSPSASVPAGRCSWPRTARRLDRHATHIVAAYVAGAARAGRGRARCASLVKTLPRWYWTLRADEQPGPDLRVRQAVAGQPRNLDLLGGQLAGGLDGALASDLAGGQPLTPRPLTERLYTHPRPACRKRWAAAAARQHAPQTDLTDIPSSAVRPAGGDGIFQGSSPPVGEEPDSFGTRGNKRELRM